MVQKRDAKKPQVPKGFPLFPHACGQWAKKIRGKLHYFGPWDDRAGALDAFRKASASLYAGRSVSRVDPDSVTFSDVLNAALESAERRADRGEITPGSFQDYLRVAKQAVEVIDRDTPMEALGPDDFAKLRDAFGAGVKLVTLQGRITRLMVLLRHGQRNGVYARQLSQITGSEFRGPPASKLRAERAKRRNRLLSAADVHRLLAVSNGRMRLAILLGINCAWGNTDICLAKPQHLKDGFAEMARSKTQVHRRCPLWPETMEALGALERWPIFPTRMVERRFPRIRRLAGVDVAGFYGLRHTFLTVAEEHSRDYPAIRMIMGHTDNSMAHHYRQAISDSRLREVTDAVREWFKKGAGQS